MAVADASKWFTRQGGEPATAFISGSDGVAAVTQTYTDFTAADTALDTAKVNTATVGNLLTANQASLEDNATTGWTAGHNATIAASTTQAKDGTHSLRLTATAADYVDFITSATIPVTAGRVYTASAQSRADSADRLVSAFIVWYDAGSGYISTSAAATSTNSTSAWTRHLSAAVAPATATQAHVMYRVFSAGASEIHYLDELGFWEGAGGQWALPGSPIADLGFYTDESCGRRLFQWDANNSRWQMTYGETGIRDVASSLETGEGYTTVTNLELRRIGNTVQLQAVTLARGSTGSGDKYCLTLPAGFWPDQTVYFRTGVSDCFAYVLLGDGKVYIRTASTSDGFTLSWQTTTAWPTTLPGSARGSIPA